MKIYFVNFCMIVSWIAVITLGIFWWVALTVPRLLEVSEDNASGAESTLIIAAAMYLVIALIMTALRGIIIRGETVKQGVTRIKQNVQSTFKRNNQTHEVSDLTSTDLLTARNTE